MASRNQNRPPRSSSTKKDDIDQVSFDKRRRIGAGRMVAPASTGRGRQAFAVVNNRQDVTAASDMGSAEGSECGTIEFTKEEVEALLNVKFKGKQFDLKGKLEQMSEHIKRLKLCINCFQQTEENHVTEKEKLQSAMETVEKKCMDTEMEMKNKVEEFNLIISDLKKNISFLEERVAKEESDKLDAIECHIKEKEARVASEKSQSSLLAELEKTRQGKSAAEHKAASFEDMYKRAQEYNMSLQQYNSKLQKDNETHSESLKRVEREKLTIVENLSNLRCHNKALQDQLTSFKASQDESIKQKELLSNELRCLRGELNQVRDDRDRQVTRVQALTAEVVKYEEFTGRSCVELDNLTLKSNALEETCSSQREQIRILQQQLTAANEKLKMTDLSASETRAEFEEKKRIVRELHDRLVDAEFQLSEGEKLRKKLHNTILELKGNIRVFCRVRPLLPDDGVETEATLISYPTSTEALGRGIDLMQSGQKYPFTFDKVFTHEASQRDVFVEISQLVQSALDGYKVCIFAYGQTGSGKTYTMMGKPETLEQKGLIPRSLEQIFQTSQSLQAQGWKYKMQASMLEIYNETIRDLLSTNRSNGLDMSRTENGIPGKQYTIKHDANGNTHVSDLTIVDVCSIKEISSLLQQAAQSRSVGRTQMNEQSSRSHFVFTLRISGVNESTEQQVQGVLNLIDLAGSERLSKSGSTGDRLKETQAINKSLSSLADVIFALAKREEHVPFRNSKLTYLLQPCLGGDSKTLMFVNISPDPSSVGESLCSLRFAARVNTCEIGIPRRQTTVRPADSRLSYG
ncbi:kinesin-like protein KIN-14C [Juglans microcarpa x Juglans regia]|uniref:kinesin-like protein KIN-14C n=1 Tax=Juglans microcarpa x Juglans regia TaxID=2249226 RepID=UPI001B7E103D|nr:kinesin-like protein KIN-14C [Juglans microcarpa x Juglans regia]